MPLRHAHRVHRSRKVSLRPSSSPTSPAVDEIAEAGPLSRAADSPYTSSDPDLEQPQSSPSRRPSRPGAGRVTTISPDHSRQPTPSPVSVEDDALEESILRLSRSPTPGPPARGQAAQLVEQMLAIQVHLSRPTKQGKTVLSFNREQVRDVLRCVVDEVMIQGLNRLNKLISDYKASSPGSVDPGTATRAQRQAMHPNTPIQAKPLFIAYGQLERALSTEGSQLRSFRVLLARLDFIDAYRWLVSAVDDKARMPGVFDETLSKQLRDLGFKPRAGCDWKTVIRNYLADTLGVDKQTIDTRLAHSAGLHLMAKHCGRAIICLVPDTIVKRSVVPPGNH